MSDPLNANKQLQAIVKRISDARCNLNTFAQIDLLCEGGSMTGSHAGARQISRICKREMQRELRVMDKAAADLLRKFAT